MNLQHLKYFQTVAMNENITLSAQQLFIPQPALSKAIASLEEELGTSLFDRKGRKIVLNESGKAFLKHVNVALSALDDAERELDAIKNGTYPDLLLNSDAYFDGLNLLMADFHKQYPQIKFMLRKENTRQNYPLRKYDAAFVMNLQGAALPPCTQVLFEEDLLLAVPEGHPLADESSVDLSALKDAEFVSFRASSDFRRTVEVYCMSAGFSPNITIETTDCRMLCDFVRAGLGISIVPEYSWRTLYTGLRLVPLRTPACRRQLLLTWFDNERLNASSRLFTSFCKNWFATHHNGE